MSRRRQLALWMLAGAGAAVTWAAFAHWPPPETGEGSFCLYRRLTGSSCPGCGMTRAVAHLAHGDLAAGFRLHPLAPLLVAEGALAWVAWGVMAARGLSLATQRWIPPLLLAHAAALLALWLLRLATGTLPP